jgi:hypothetical protein
MQRRQFLRVLGGGAAGSVLVAACGDDGGGAPIDAPASCSEHGAISIISGNHGHSMIVTAAEIGAPMDRDYDLMGSADHTHTATVASALFEQLATNSPVQVTSTVTNGHSHAITIRCR